ncbi:unnamed protein product [Polarella glacialis]|uniref:RNA-editing substrate-binding complex 6 protein domain-containing protein n=1 Tax=Polarella glacialis TaxID=89957 RepID=A0A813E7X7_POLGL|nr:unnamed protein product [Polarella glacialis]
MAAMRRSAARATTAAAPLFASGVSARAVSAAPVQEDYTPQQVLRLCTHLHSAFVSNDKARLRALGLSLVPMLHLLRPSEVSIALNHFAHAKVLDMNLWQPISDMLPEVFIDPDCKALGLAANAYARASLKHEAALAFIADSARALANQGNMEGRNVAMLINGYSKLRVRHPGLMEVLSQQLIPRVKELNEIDLATVANGFARMAVADSQLFDALREPTAQAMEKFSVQNLAMLANAHARIMRRDTALLDLVAAELHKRSVAKGQPIAAKYLPSIVHAFAMKLSLCPPDLVQVVEFSLPRVIGQMEKSDVILTVPSLVHIPSLCAPPDFRNPVFNHCLSIMPELTGNAVVSILEAALFLRHDCQDFWRGSLQHCEASLSRNGASWELKYVSTLALLVAEVWAGAAPTGVTWPLFGEDQKSDLFAAITTAAGACARINDSSEELRAVADLAVAAARAEVANPELEGLLLRRARELLIVVPSSAVAVAGSEASRGERQQASRLIEALRHTHGPGLFEAQPAVAGAAQRLNLSWE